MLKVNINNFNIITLVLLICCQTFVIPIGTKYMLISTIFMLISFILLLITNTGKFLSVIKKFITNKYIFIFLAFCCWTIFSSFVLTCLGKTSFSISASNIFLGLFFSVSLPLFFSFYFAKSNNIRTIIKVLYLAIYLIVVFGFLDFCAFKFSIEPLKELFYILVNQRILANDTTGEAVKVIIAGFPRVQSFFVEPGLFAYFMALIAPFIFKFSTRKYQIFSNKYFDKFIKYTCPALAIFDVLLSLSPIGIIFNTLVYTFLIVRTSNYRKNGFKILFGILFFIIFLTVFFVTCPIAEKILSRLVMVKYLITNFNQFTLLEESLATRLVFYINCVCIFFNNAFFGVGWGHLGLDLQHQLMHSPVPLTYEIISGMAREKGTTYGLVISYRILAETGIIGFVLFYAFIINIVANIKNRIKIKWKFLSDFMFSAYYYLIFFIIFSFYESLLYAPHYWVFIGIIISILPKIKAIERRLK